VTADVDTVPDVIDLAWVRVAGWQHCRISAGLAFGDQGEMVAGGSPIATTCP